MPQQFEITERSLCIREMSIELHRCKVGARKTEEGTNRKGTTRHGELYLMI